eukprot:CAMPEP_0185204000 /NCGR_PEP_ID=MMETSP1140-20130426/54019_1 /TAXON_ID=298111 /ORGANISM="Pavlova sp., Strain CCMP459" /LENGTH=158 /DNA_ID=CAMNT_0027771523 /DNA_START=26 /DNA_END=498 /DNA_ORIENTATION=-
MRKGKQVGRASDHGGQTQKINASPLAILRGPVATARRTLAAALAAVAVGLVFDRVCRPHAQIGAAPAPDTLAMLRDVNVFEPEQEVLDAVASLLTKETLPGRLYVVSRAPRLVVMDGILSSEEADEIAGTKSEIHFQPGKVVKVDGSAQAYESTVNYR